MITESIWMSIIQWTISPVILLVVGAFLNRRIKETRKEITNSHPVHLRDDLDSKFHLLYAKIDTVRDTVDNVDSKLDTHVAAYKVDNAEVFKTLADHESRLTGQAGKLRRISRQ